MGLVAGLLAKILASCESRDPMIPYSHKVHPRATRLKITVKPSGEVVVTTPKSARQSQIVQFVQNNQNWIEKMQAKLKARRPVLSPETITIFGKNYIKSVEYSTEKPIGIHIEKTKLILNPLTPSQSHIWKKEYDAQLNRFLKNTATNYIIPRTHQLAEKMSISFKNITLREQSTRWGSCSSRGNLNFNWRLVHFETPIIDYVIIHELAHRTHMDHSKKFWDLVRKFDPDYLKHRGVLKRSSINLD